MNSFETLVKYFIDTSFDLVVNDQIPRNWKEERQKFYFKKLMDLYSIIEKVERYEIYFLEFYPKSDKINEVEAIEYHWHSYIHDLFILRERIKGIIGSLKNDLPRYKVKNLEEARKALEHLRIQSLKGLEKAHKARTTLSHDFTLRNLNLVRAKALKILIQQKNITAPLKIEKIEEKYKVLTRDTKDKYVAMAANNKKELQKMKDFFAPRFGLIFASLNGHDTSIFKC